LNRRSVVGVVSSGLLALLLVVAFAGPASAGGGKQKIATKPKLEFAMGFEGRLKTGKRCKAGRLITLYSTRVGPDKKEATRTSNTKGRFDFGTEVLPTDGGTFYVRAKRAPHQAYVCKPGKSNELAFAG
jgi:hypothetical protein